MKPGRSVTLERKAELEAPGVSGGGKRTRSRDLDRALAFGRNLSRGHAQPTVAGPPATRAVRITGPCDARGIGPAQ